MAKRQKTVRIGKNYVNELIQKKKNTKSFTALWHVEKQTGGDKRPMTLPQYSSEGGWGEGMKKTEVTQDIEGA